MRHYEIPRGSWRPYFDHVSRLLAGRQLAIEVADQELGVQCEGERLALDGVTYDAHDDAIFVHSAGLDHRIDHPDRVAVFENGDGLAILAVRDHGGSVQLMRVESLPLLPDLRL